MSDFPWWSTYHVVCGPVRAQIFSLFSQSFSTSHRPPFPYDASTILVQYIKYYCPFMWQSCKIACHYIIFLHFIQWLLNASANRNFSLCSSHVGYVHTFHTWPSKWRTLLISALGILSCMSRMMSLLCRPHLGSITVTVQQPRDITSSIFLAALPTEASWLLQPRFSHQALIAIKQALEKVCPWVPMQLRVFMLLSFPFPPPAKCVQTIHNPEDPPVPLLL